MKYSLSTGAIIEIPDKEIQNLMTNLDLTKIEAVETWLVDNDYEINEEQQELDNKAKKVKINRETGRKKVPKTDKKPINVKVSDEKKSLFNTILSNLDRNEFVERENITVIKENKLIQVEIGDKIFKIDLIQTRNK